jgi:hypothetical protein
VKCEQAEQEDLSCDFLIVDSNMHRQRLLSMTNPEVCDLLECWVEKTHAILAENIIGLYVTGSLTYGDFVPKRSDVDLAAVVQQPLSATELMAVKHMHEQLESQFPTWKCKIECSYIPLHLLSATLPPLEPRPWWGFGVFYEQAPYGNEWIINKYFLWKCSIALMGPRFADLAAPVSMHDVQQASARDLFQEWEGKIQDPEWLQNSHHQSYLVLNLCRILYTVLKGDATSKAIAAQWARKKFSEWTDLIDEALAWRYGMTMERSTEAIAFLTFALDYVRRHYP